MDILEHVNLKPYNTFGVEAGARWFCCLEHTDDLMHLVREGLTKQAHLVLGGGSNVLFTADYDGLVILNRLRGREIVDRTGSHVLLRCGSGENWHETVLFALERGWGGIENLSLIPGTVGAAPIQNIGAYGVELESVFEELEAIDLVSGERKIFRGEDCRFGYRNSVFKQELKGRYFITTVTLRLSLEPEVNISYAPLQHTLEEWGMAHPGIRDLSRAVIHIRQSKLPDPRQKGNAGSFFKNPVLGLDDFRKLQQEWGEVPHYPVNEKQVKVPAGWLIDQCGWKGRRIGNAGTWPQQALVIINHGNASGQEIFELAMRIRDDVAKRFGITLEPEVNILP